MIKKIKEKYAVDFYTDLDEFLNIKKLDYVIISATNDVHEELVIKALNKGKNVIVEKPMSINYGSTQRMIEVANKNNKNLLT